MGTITTTFAGTTIGSYTVSVSGTEEETGRSVVYLGRKYGIAPVDADAIKAILSRWFRDCVSETHAQMLADERGRAAAAAAAAIAPIDPMFSE